MIDPYEFIGIVIPFHGNPTKKSEHRLPGNVVALKILLSFVQRAASQVM